ncbi:unnamed protein product, partial [Symbiodinium sp. CCMP2592]
ARNVTRRALICTVATSVLVSASIGVHRRLAMRRTGRFGGTNLSGAESSKLHQACQWLRSKNFIINFNPIEFQDAEVKKTKLAAESLDKAGPWTTCYGLIDGHAFPERHRGINWPCDVAPECMSTKS